jgi:hypothetical protein
MATNKEEPITQLEGDTDTLSVTLFESLGPVSKAGALCALGIYGPIADLSFVTPELEIPRVCLCTYCDLRDAAKAHQALQERSTPVEKSAKWGQRKVLLPRNLKLDPKLFEELLPHVKKTHEEEAGFMVEFFDVRHGHAMNKKVIAMQQANSSVAASKPKSMEPARVEPSTVVTAESNPGLSFGKRARGRYTAVVPPPGLGRRAMAVTKTAVSDVTMVLIRGLPSELCNLVSMEAVLQQAGIADEVESCEPYPGEIEGSCGEARVGLRGKAAVDKCFNHFQDMTWHATITVSVQVMGPAALKKSFTPLVEERKGSWAVRALDAQEFDFNSLMKNDWDTEAETAASTEAESDGAEDEDTRQRCVSGGGSETSNPGDTPNIWGQGWYSDPYSLWSTDTYWKGPQPCVK